MRAISPASAGRAGRTKPSAMTAQRTRRAHRRDGQGVRVTGRAGWRRAARAARHRCGRTGGAVAVALVVLVAASCCVASGTASSTCRSTTAPSTTGCTTAARSTTTSSRDSTYGFTYPPFAALVMLPMAYLGWPARSWSAWRPPSVAGTAVLWWLVDPIARRQGWTRWFALAVAVVPGGGVRADARDGHLRAGQHAAARAGRPATCCCWCAGAAAGPGSASAWPPRSS